MGTYIKAFRNKNGGRDARHSGHVPALS